MKLKASDFIKSVKYIYENIPEDKRHREYLKLYSNSGKRYSFSINQSKEEWANNYTDSRFEPRINLIERLSNVILIEFDTPLSEDGLKPSDALTECEKTLKKLGIGYIRTSHQGKCDYLWIEFSKSVADADAKKFLEWIRPKKSRIDMNFSSSNKIFPVIFAPHRKYPHNEEIVYFSDGNKVNLSKLDIPKDIKVEVISEKRDGFEYETSQGVNNFDRAKYLLSQDKPRYHSLGVGVHKDIYYFGTKIYDGIIGLNAIVTSDKKIHVAYKDNDQIKQFGINYRFDFLDSILDYQWSNNGSEYSIMEFLYGKEKQVSLKECYQEVYENNISFMDYNEDLVNVSIACDILSSYYLPIFEAKGRSFFNAEKGSGKTKQSMLYDLQMFNPLMSADITGAAMFRAIESTSCSLIIDDFDLLDDDKKTMNTQIIRTGYKKGQKSVRAGEDQNRTPNSFNIFSSMVINNVGGLDEITLDRCNVYYLIKSVNEDKSNKKLDEKNKLWTTQRDKRYYCALQNWNLVKETYEKLGNVGFRGRDYERIAPILTIGKIVLDNKTYEELIEFELNRVNDNKVRDVSDDWCFQAIKFVIGRLKEEKKGKIDLQLDVIVKGIIDIPEIIKYGDNEVQNKEYHKKKHAISIYLGKIFKNTPLFKSSKVHGGYVKYTFTASAIIKFIEIRDYKEFFDEIDIQLIQPIQPILYNQSIQSIQPIQSIQNNIISGEVGEVGEVEEVRNG